MSYTYTMNFLESRHKKEIIFRNLNYNCMVVPGSLRWRLRNVLLGSVLGATFCFPLGNGSPFMFSICFVVSFWSKMNTWSLYSFAIVAMRCFLGVVPSKWWIVLKVLRPHHITAPCYVILKWAALMV